MVIWIGAAVSIGVPYFYKIEGQKLHAIIVGLMAVDDRPFSG